MDYRWSKMLAKKLRDDENAFPVEMKKNIIIAEDRMKLCEINSYPAIDYEQIICGPVLSRKKVKEFFENKGLFNFVSRLLYKGYMESRE